MHSHAETFEVCSKISPKHQNYQETCQQRKVESFVLAKSISQCLFNEKCSGLAEKQTRKELKTSKCGKRFVVKGHHSRFNCTGHQRLKVLREAELTIENSYFKYLTTCGHVVIHVGISRHYWAVSGLKSQTKLDRS